MFRNSVQVGEGKATASPTKNNGASPAKVNGDTPTKANGRSPNKRKRTAAASAGDDDELAVGDSQVEDSQMEKTPKAKRPPAKRDVKKEAKSEDEESEELPFGKQVVVKNGQLKIAESSEED